jgi:hypothetical protein
MLDLSLGGDYVYSLFAFFDMGSTGPVDGLEYRNYGLKNCSIRTLGLAQTAQPIAKINVLSYLRLSLIIGSDIL